MSKNKNGWDKKLGTSKKEQGVITLPPPRYKKFKNGKLKCKCLFRGKELWQECWRHIFQRQQEAFMKEMLARLQTDQKKKMKRKQIRSRTTYWQRKMGLDNWDIDVTFEKERGAHKDSATVAYATTDSQYKLATINYIPTKEKYISDAEIVHELLHVTFAPLVGYARGNLKKKERDWINYFNEQVVSDISRIILRIKDGKTNIKR